MAFIVVTSTVVCCGVCLLTQLKVYAMRGVKALGVYGTYHFRLILGLLHQFVSCFRLDMNCCSAVYLLLFSACLVITVLFVLYRIIVFTVGICCLPLVLMLFSVAIIWM